MSRGREVPVPSAALRWAVAVAVGLGLSACTCDGGGGGARDAPSPEGEAEVLADAPGLHADRVRWSAEQEAGWVWRVRLPRSRSVLSVLPSDDVVPMDAFPLPRTEAWAAINGGFYEDGPMGLVLANGEELAPLQPRGGSGVMVVGHAGVRVVHASAWPQAATHALQSIDRLVVDGSNVVSPTADDTKAARSAVALTAGHVWFVASAADASISQVGPRSWALDKVYGHGMTLHQFAAWLQQELGADDALNLDGGLSTQMRVRVPGGGFALRGVSGTINVVVAEPGVTRRGTEE